MKYYIILLFITLAAVGISSCGEKSGSDQTNKEPETEAYEPNEQAAKANSDEKNREMSIFSLAEENPDLSTFVAAINHAERTQMLNSNGPFTVFAPTNQAFDALPAGTVDNLMKPENKGKLADILAYHVVEGSVKLDDLADGQTITTVHGNTLTVSKQNGQVMINDAEVINADIKAKNGILHVVNKVLMPSEN